MTDYETHYRRLLETSQDGIIMLDGNSGVVIEANPSLLNILGASPEEIIGKKLSEIIWFKDSEESHQAFLELQNTDHIFHEDVRLVSKDGRRVEVEFTGDAYLVESKRIIQYKLHDITAHKQAEADLRFTEAKYRNLVERLPIATYLDQVNENSSTLFFSPQIEAISGYSPDAWESDSELWRKLLHPDDRERVLAENVRTNQTGDPFRIEYRIVSREGKIVWVRDEAVLMHDSAGISKFWQGMLLDISESKRAEEQIRRQFAHLTALRTIDTAIASSLDSQVVLDIVLEQITTQLGVDAADVLLLNTETLMLEFAAGRGFRTNALQQTQLRLGQGYAGMAGQEQKTIHVPNLGAHTTDFLRSPYFKYEGFDTYYGVPLVAKGQLKGVLEIFHREPLYADEEWLGFMEILAGQSAIAVDNAMLFAGLQRANIDLKMAYDATIEGWSKALDLRDKETEGHTQRVTEMTLKLARSVGMSEGEMANVRRGALLHDIGKMGIPDSILLKPDKLTDEEWVIMRFHPYYAKELLSPIDYLRPSLDIPFDHHEKWDGSGYPRGLKGEEIPIAARLFAVVDVWDALRSDRPYRKAWNAQKVLEYIRSLSGTQFDPKALELFLDFLGPITEAAD